MKKYLAVTLLFSACAMQGMDYDVARIAGHADSIAKATEEIAKSMSALDAKFEQLASQQVQQAQGLANYRKQKLALLERQTTAQEAQVAMTAQLVLTQQIMVNKMVEAASTMASGISELEEVNFNKIDPALAKLVQGAQTNNNSKEQGKREPSVLKSGRVDAFFKAFEEDGEEE